MPISGNCSDRMDVRLLDPSFRSITGTRSCLKYIKILYQVNILRLPGDHFHYVGMTVASLATLSGGAIDERGGRRGGPPWPPLGLRSPCLQSGVEPAGEPTGLRPLEPQFYLGYTRMSY